ncbi:hypothetical protein KBD33_03220 [Candidatus Gracilibacteria bacterium]|nr:hypothetical protein [Candidatus Gracilibacteria bacterium]
MPKKYLIISIVTLVLIAGGIGTYYFLGIEDPIEENIPTPSLEVQKIETNTGVSEVVSGESDMNNSEYALLHKFRALNQTDLNKINDLYIKNLLVYNYNNYIDVLRRYENHSYIDESADWKIYVEWDEKFIHPVTLTIENKKTGERNTQIVAYDKEWREEIIKRSKKCSTSKVCSDSELEEEMINNLEGFDSIKSSYAIFDNEYIVSNGFNDKIYKIPENGNVDFSDKSKDIIMTFASIDTVHNSPYLLIRDSGAIPYFPCANLITKQELESKISGSRCDFFTLSEINQFSYSGKLVVFVHATNQVDNPTEFRYYPKNLDEYIKQEDQYLPPEAKSLRGEWPKINTFYIYDLLTGKFEKKIEFPGNFNF